MTVVVPLTVIKGVMCNRCLTSKAADDNFHIRSIVWKKNRSGSLLLSLLHFYFFTLLLTIFRLNWSGRSNVGEWLVKINQIINSTSY